MTKRRIRAKSRTARRKKSAHVPQSSGTALRDLPDVVVIGAGAFGGWTAWHLANLGGRGGRGTRVTLLDAWGAGNPRGTSSGEARILRLSYGEKHLYSEWTQRAREIWRECEAEWRVPLFLPCGMLWVFREENAYYRESVATLRRLKEPWERLSGEEAARRFPQVAFKPGEFALYEPKAGMVRAQRAVQTVAAQLARLGGVVRTGWAEAPADSARGSGARLASVRVRSGAGEEELYAGAFVFACGPWLPQMFPRLMGRRIVVTQQDVFYFGAPAGDARFDAPQLPAWADYDSEFYGTPGCDVCGFKLANNQGQPGFDPTSGERTVRAETLAAARRYLARRFPGMADAPLVRTRVCQYERTPDSNVVVDRHPEWENVWLAGGGSGHGFKFGPALGEWLAAMVLDGRPAKIPAPLRIGASEHAESGELREKGAY
ncbi:MAG TPA: FAD-dependent oxidoreductase [Patescibacteria group bacterium]|nr:FAD-dependent oxidoreductase [Patescibacteria group bacterium]